MRRPDEAELTRRHFIVPIDGIPVRVHTDGSLVTPNDVEAIRDVIRALRASRDRAGTPTEEQP